MYPRLVIDLEKLRQNGQALCRMAQAAGVDQVAFVTKVFCADGAMVKALLDTPCAYLADSRIENLRRYPETDRKKLLLRLPMPSQAEEVVRWADLSLNSEAVTLRALDAAAGKLGRRHGVVLMIDLGDLREGMFFRNEAEILSTADLAEQLPNLDLLGVGFNVTCYGSVLPTEENTGVFLAIKEKIEGRLGRSLPLISGGNSSSLYLMRQGRLPKGINNLRLGESLVLGRETAYGQDLEGLHQDVVTLEVELVEVKRKPSYPVGTIGVNAFGEKPRFEDHGVRLRAIAAIGRQDMEVDGLIPLDPGVSVVGASSDHLILDMTEAEGIPRPGDVVSFKLTYAGVLRAFTSSYVERTYRG